jgi:amino acid transporter
MESTNTPSTKGKGLGMAGMIIGIVCAVLSLIPGVAIVMSVIALIGLILSFIGFMQAKNGGNPNKGIMIAGIVLNLLVIIWGVYQAFAVASAVTDGLENLDTAALRKQVEDAMSGH